MFSVGPYSRPIFCYHSILTLRGILSQDMTCEIEEFYCALLTVLSLGFSLRVSFSDLSGCNYVLFESLRITGLTKRLRIRW